MQTGFHTETVVSIKKKLVMIKNRMPFSADMKRYFADIERRNGYFETCGSTEAR